jgi:predicted permease
MIRSVVDLQRSDPGFDADRVLSVAINLYGERYFEEGSNITFFHEVERRIAALPGVRAVGSISILPLTGRNFRTRWGVGTEDDPQWAGLAGHRRVVSGRFFEAMGTRLLAGRMFSELEMSEESSVVVVGESLTRAGWPGEDPVGKKLIANWRGQPAAWEIVGVVEDVRFQDVRVHVAPAIYWPIGTTPSWAQTLVVRGPSPPGTLAAPIRGIVRDLDPGLAPHSIRDMSELVRLSLASSRFVLGLMAAFAGLAVVLAVGGLYGVIAHTVRQRVPEIGIRMALGAGASDILRMILGQGGALVAGGVVAGIVGSLALSRFIRSLLYGVATADVATLATTGVALSAVALLACYVAARGATRVDPVAALRAE